MIQDIFACVQSTEGIQRKSFTCEKIIDVLFLYIYQSRLSQSERYSFGIPPPHKTAATLTTHIHIMYIRKFCSGF